MFQLRTDAELIELARNRVAEAVGATLTDEQAVRLIVVTNDLVCPALER